MAVCRNSIYLSLSVRINTVFFLPRAPFTVVCCLQNKSKRCSGDQNRRNYSSTLSQRARFGQKKCATLLTCERVATARVTDWKRQFSAETYNKYFAPDVVPIGFAQKVLESVHSATGLPWWASIGVTTIALRGIVTLPLAVYSTHIMAKVELLQPEIAQLSKELRREVAMAVKKFAWNERTARFKYNSTMKKLVKDLYIRENCHPAKSSLVLWFQIPMWVCLSFALRNMSGAVPSAHRDPSSAVLCPDLQTEGVLWFPDLTVPDTTWILPLALGLTNLLNIEMHTLTAKNVGKFQKGVTVALRTLCLVMVPIGAAVPSSMCYYWLCSSLFGLTQNLLFKTPSIRRLLRIPLTPSESQTPFKDLCQAAREKYMKQ